MAIKKLGVLAVTYSGRCSAMVDALARSKMYDVSLYIADNQKNPFNYAHATQHRVIPNSDVPAIVDFAMEYGDKIDMVVIGPEKPIIGGLRDEIERLNPRIKVLCPLKRAALESDKGLQREILQECYPQANPRFKIFRKDSTPLGSVKDAAYAFWDELGGLIAVKPAEPLFGKGVGVFGDHFTTFDEMWANYFAPNFEAGPVVLEEKLEGEEFSAQFLCDGVHLVATPLVRDHKRRDDGDKGPNTGGTDAYSDADHLLPYLRLSDATGSEVIAYKLFSHLSKLYGANSLRGIPFYMGLMATRDGVKLIEDNSRPGDPEWQAVMAMMEDDFADICVRMAEGRLTHVNFRPEAAVVKYKMPPHYAGKGQKPVDTRVNLGNAYFLEEKSRGKLRIYPASIELKDDGSTHSLSSRTVCAVGRGDTIEEARMTAQDGLNAIKGDLWQRYDPATEASIQISIDHMHRLRNE